MMELSQEQLPNKPTSFPLSYNPTWGIQKSGAAIVLKLLATVVG
jgi:hypothetical protein